MNLIIIFVLCEVKKMLYICYACIYTLQKFFLVVLRLRTMGVFKGKTFKIKKNRFLKFQTKPFENYAMSLA